MNNTIKNQKSPLEKKLKELALQYKLSSHDDLETGPSLLIYMPSGKEEHKKKFLRLLREKVAKINNISKFSLHTIDLKHIDNVETLQLLLKQMSLKNTMLVIDNLQVIESYSSIKQQDEVSEFFKSITGKENVIEGLDFKDTILVLKSEAHFQENNHSQIPALLNRIRNFGDAIDISRYEGILNDNESIIEDLIINGVKKELKEIGKEFPKELENSTKIAIKEKFGTPVKILGIGMGGVGKSTLARSIFSFYNKLEPSNESLARNNVNVGNTDFQRVIIKSPFGGKVLLTDSPGFGRSKDEDNLLLSKVIEEIKSHDLIYWVMTASSYRGTPRSIIEIMEQLSKELINEKVKFEDKIVIVLNKIDQIDLSSKEKTIGLKAWDLNYNTLTYEALSHVNELVNLVATDFKQFRINQDQIIYCSAETGYRTDLVFDKLIDLLPKDKRISLYLNGEFDYTTKNKAAQIAYSSTNFKNNDLNKHNFKKRIRNDDQFDKRIIKNDDEDYNFSTNNKYNKNNYNITEPSYESKYFELQKNGNSLNDNEEKEKQKHIVKLDDTKQVNIHIEKKNLTPKEMATKEYIEFSERNKKREEEKKKTFFDVIENLFHNKLAPILMVINPTIQQLVNLLSRIGQQNKSSQPNYTQTNLIHQDNSNNVIDFDDYLGIDFY